MIEHQSYNEGSRIALSNRWMQLSLILLIFVAIFTIPIVQEVGLWADLRALWVAGHFWQTGQIDLIYPQPGPLFDMRPRAEWMEWLDATYGYRDEAYPFLYPPLWAVLASYFTSLDFQFFSIGVLWLNTVWLTATVVLAIRATRAAINPLLHTALVLIVFAFSPLVIVGLMQGQPQIFVSFLIVLAIERSRAGADYFAGAALALAAAIKLYPAVFVIVWLVRGQWRAVAGFLVVGVTLAGASVLLAGWPLHQQFLASVAQVNRTILLTNATANVDSLLAQFGLGGALQPVFPGFLDASAELHSSSDYWYIIERPHLWGLVDNAVLIGGLIGLAAFARRASETVLYGAIWPLMLIYTVLFSPISWIYYLIPVLVLSPAMIGLVRGRWGVVMWVLAAILVVTFHSGLAFWGAAAPMVGPFITVSLALIWAMGFALSARATSA